LLLQSAPCLLNRAASAVPAASARQTVGDLLIGQSVRVGTCRRTTWSAPAAPNAFGVGERNAAGWKVRIP